MYLNLHYTHSRKYTISYSADHDKIGEDFLLSLGYPTDVTKFVRGHVQVKKRIKNVSSSISQ